MTRRHAHTQRFGPFEPFVPGPCEATYTLDRQIAAARRQMGEAEWQRLNAEWLA